MASKKSPWLSYRQLDMYFKNPDSQIRHTSEICAHQFTKDLDFIIQFSKNNSAMRGRIDSYSIRIDTNRVKKRPRASIGSALQTSKGLNLFKCMKNSLGCKRRPKTKVIIQSWNFTEFDPAEKFHVRGLYAIKPIRITYNWTQQDYIYNKQIISEFCIEETNGNIKKLVIIDSLKNKKIKREKYIDDQNIAGQHHQFGIRSHRLNRGLMKTFLFHQINGFEKFEYGPDYRLRHNHADYYLQNTPRWQLEPGVTFLKPKALSVPG